MGPTKLYYLKGFASWAAFGGPNRFCDKKLAPSAPKVRLRTKNEPK